MVRRASRRAAFARTDGSTGAARLSDSTELVEVSPKSSTYRCRMAWCQAPASQVLTREPNSWGNRVRVRVRERGRYLRFSATSRWDNENKNPVRISITGLTSDSRAWPGVLECSATL